MGTRVWLHHNPILGKLIIYGYGKTRNPNKEHRHTKREGDLTRIRPNSDLDSPPQLKDSNTTLFSLRTLKNVNRTKDTKREVLVHICSMLWRFFFYLSLINEYYQLGFKSSRWSLQSLSDRWCKQTKDIQNYCTRIKLSWLYKIIVVVVFLLTQKIHDI